MTEENNETQPKRVRRAASRPAGPPAEGEGNAAAAKQPAKKRPAKKAAAAETATDQPAKASTRKRAAAKPKSGEVTDSKPSTGSGAAAPKVDGQKADAQKPAVPLAAVFAAPDAAVAPVKRARSRKAESEASGAEAAGAEEGGSKSRKRQPKGKGGKNGASSAAEVKSEASESPGGSTEGGPRDHDGEGDGDGGRRRRRRGGRGRRRRGGNDNGAANHDHADDTDENVDEASAVEGEPSSETEGEGSARRRRSRRRGGDSEDGGKSRDESTAVKGSTRLEAKKQRRREGREAGRRRAPILSEAEFLARRESFERVMVVREHDDRVQIAVLEDGVLVEHYVNRQSGSSMIGNVYLGRIQNVLPSMEAAFVDIGRGRNAVLYAGEVNWDAAGLDGQAKRIEMAFKTGDPVLVQVTKDPVGHKGARLTAQISLPGRFVVYVPDGSMTGISRKLPERERNRLKTVLRSALPEEAGVIVRTAAEGAAEEDLKRDVARLQAQWEDIDKKRQTAKAPSLLYSEPDLAIRVVRDVFNEDFKELIVAGDEIHETLEQYLGHVAPELAPRLRKWTDSKEVFAHHRIDEQIAKALDRKVWLPSGGSLVIDRTEAMTVVDVNTGKFTGEGGNLEQTVTRNNLEAAEEIVRQLRLRDIGGIIVIDFIDMVLESNRDLVLRRLIECLGRDRTKHQVAEVTSLGLVQMTRKKIGQGLLETFSEPCEACHARGVKVSLDRPQPKEPVEA